MDSEVRLRLYELALQEEQHFDKMHHDRIAFYAGLLSALTTAALIALMSLLENEVTWLSLLLLLPLPLLLYAIAGGAVDGTGRVYLRFLEAIALRAKLEQDLGLTDEGQPVDTPPRRYWVSESYVLTRYLESRTGFQSSDDFVRRQMSGGYRAVVVRMFRIFQIASVLAAVLIVVEAIVLLMAG